MFLNLIVLRARDIEALGEFYTALGMNFVRERHGSGPEHLAYSLGGTTIEIYPCREQNTQGLRLGFCVENVASRFDDAIANGAEAISGPRRSKWGDRAIIRDPEGHIVELVKPKEAEAIAS